MGVFQKKHIFTIIKISIDGIFHNSSLFYPLADFNISFTSLFQNSKREDLFKDAVIYKNSAKIDSAHHRPHLASISY
jgi:hypothetical protein